MYFLHRDKIFNIYYFIDMYNLQSIIIKFDLIQSQERVFTPNIYQIESIFENLFYD